MTMLTAPTAGCNSPDSGIDFASYAERLETERRLRHSVKAAAAQLDAAARACLLRLRAAHRPGRRPVDAASAARESLASCRLCMADLAKLLPDAELQYRHQHLWRRGAQRLALAVSLLHFLERGRPASHAQVASELGLAGGVSDPRLQLGDHLQGLLALSSELARLSVNAVIAADGDVAQQPADLPGRALDCVTDLRGGFRLLLAASSALESTRDAAAASALASAEPRLAAELAKIEDVVYDVTVRRRRRLE